MSRLSDRTMATLAFFCWPLAWQMDLHPLIVTLKVSLHVNWVSCKQHIDGSCSPIHYVNLCLLIGALSPLTFRARTERYEFTAIMLFVHLEFLVVIWLWIYWIDIHIHHVSPHSVPLKIACRTVLVARNSFNFCLSGNFFSLLLFWMTALLDKESLAAYFSYSALSMCPTTPLMPAKYLCIGFLQTWPVFPCSLGTCFPCCLHDSLLAWVFCEFDCDIPCWGLFFVESNGGPLWFLVFDVRVFPQVTKVFCYDLLT